MCKLIFYTILLRYQIAKIKNSKESDEQGDDFFFNAILLIIMIGRRRLCRLQSKKRDIYLRHKELGEYYNLVQELRLGDREFYYR
jgi:prolipoprotein diacylglyceryltransferase